MFKVLCACVVLLLSFQSAIASAPPWLHSTMGGVVNTKADKDGNGSLIVRSGKGHVAIPFELMKAKKADREKQIFGFTYTVKEMVQPVVAIEEEYLFPPEPMLPSSFMRPAEQDQPKVTYEEAVKLCDEANKQMMEQWTTSLGASYKKLAGDAVMPCGVTLRIFQSGADETKMDYFIVDPESGSVWKQE